MDNAIAWMVLGAPLAMLAAGAVALRTRGEGPTRARRAARAAAGTGVVLAVCAALALVLEGQLQSPTLGAWELGLAVRLDPLSVVMFTMVALLAVVILRYSESYLAGEARQGEFLGRLALTVASVELLVLSANLATLVVAWVATSLALHRLLVFFPDRPRAIRAARKKFLAARCGDLLLVSASVALYLQFDTGDLATIFERSAAGAGGVAVTVAALCLAGAAMLKSAMFPAHGWLVEVMETPTPVSALLHAGILNAGPFLVMRMSFVIDGATVAMAALVVVGAVTAVIASLARMAQPSVKVALGYSSAGHMGFSLMLCGFGLVPAAMLHLVAHSFYKAHAFLSSGSTVDEGRAAAVDLPRRLSSPTRAVAALAAAAGCYLLAAAAWGVGPTSEPGLFVLGAVMVLAVARLLVGVVDTDGPRWAWAVAVGGAVVIVNLFFALESLSHWLLHDVVPADSATGTAFESLALLVVLAFAAVLWGAIAMSRRSARSVALAVHFRNGLYANALFDRLVDAIWAPIDLRRVPTRSEQETAC